jgi:hypothetical protein
MKGKERMKKITLICDRCGKEFNNVINEKRTVTISCNYGYPGVGEQYDLCSECYKEFTGWWNQESAVIGFEDVNKIIGHLECDDCNESMPLACELRRLINGN